MIKSNEDMAKILHSMSWDADKKDPQNSLEPIRFLNESLKYDANCFGSLSDLACRFFRLGLFDTAIYYAKRAVISKPEATLAWDNFNGIINSFIESLESEELKKTYLNEIYNFLNEEFILKRMKIPEITPGDILIRVMDSSVFADNLYTKGEIRFVPTSEYRKTEDQSRVDKDENRPIEHAFIENDKPITLNNEIKEFHFGPFTVGHGGAGKSTIYSSKMTIGGMENIACFTLITKEKLAEFLSSYDCEKFGDEVIIITNVQMFNHKVSTYLASQGKLNVRHGAITYMHQDNLSAWKAILTPYLKRLYYQEEMEYRYSYSGKTEAEIVQIGSLEDISIRIKSNNLKHWVEDHFARR